MSIASAAQASPDPLGMAWGQLFLEAPVTVSTLLLAVGLLVWAAVYTWRHRTVSASTWAALQAVGWVAYAFVWGHFYYYGVTTMEAEGAQLGGIVDNVRSLIARDIVAEYFALFSRPEMNARHVAFWLFDIRDLTILAFAWMGIETRRRGAGFLACLGWLNTAFLATLCGGVALFASVMPEHADPSWRPSGATLVGLALLLFVCAVNMVTGFTDTGLSLQVLLTFGVGLAPLSRTGTYKVEHIYATIGTFAVATRGFDWAAAFLGFGARAPAMVVDAAVSDPVIFGTISGEVFNLTLLIAAISGLVSRDWRVALIPPVATLTTGLAAGCAALLWLRERNA